MAWNSSVKYSMQLLFKVWHGSLLYETIPNHKVLNETFVYDTDFHDHYTLNLKHCNWGHHGSYPPHHSV